MNALQVHSSLLAAIQLACDQQSVTEVKEAPLDQGSKVEGDEDETGRISTARNMSFILSQSPHLPLGWTADSNEVHMSDVDIMRKNATISALNNK